MRAPDVKRKGRPPGSTKRPIEFDPDIIELVEAEVRRSVPLRETGWSGRRYLTPFSFKRACELIMRRGPIKWVRRNIVVARITNAGVLRKEYYKAKERSENRWPLAVARGTIVVTGGFAAASPPAVACEIPFPPSIKITYEKTTKVGGPRTAELVRK